MPELPEVATIISSLKPLLVGRRITGTEVFLAKMVKSPSPEDFIREVTGRVITGIERKGKFLLFLLDQSHLIVVHLRMTGRLICCSLETPRDKYLHVVFYLDDGNELRFQDMRQFGTINFMPLGDRQSFAPLQALGPDALDPALTRDALKKRFNGRRGHIKSVLLDQAVVCGLGNIYANEVLWKARIHPERSVDTLTNNEVARLYKCIKEILNEAVEHRGTTLRDYVDSHGVPGDFQKMLSVHGREGELCPVCGHKIEKLKCGGRSAYVCPCCQK